MTEQQINDLTQMIGRVDHNISTSRLHEFDGIRVYVHFYRYELLDFLSALARQVETTHGHDLTMSEILGSATLQYDRDTGDPESITWLIED